MGFSYTCFLSFIVLHGQKLLSGLVDCLKDEDPNVRKSCTYAIGNAAYHTGDLYRKLGVAVPPLVKLLDDPVAKTRANAASALGNLTIHSSDLSPALLQQNAVKSILETACHDSQFGVQECCLTALRSMASRPALRQELIKLNATQKLSEIQDGGRVTPHIRRSMALSKSTGRHSLTTVMLHCTKLIRLLSTGS
ncbi:hypothetical protein LSH36_15g02117 [Paralvinella palmiformis]|uniref:non-specific serine/threonine protein kinase n=1 Tax=Paralvinella palmiformis TaxID=53620 RepID=A0AAD9KBH1_9ANNE|nr:hypothetical protein LSH36_15g02117 [Paralvinella palmiformis]